MLKKKVIITIIARLGSKRLPRKCLLPIFKNENSLDVIYKSALKVTSAKNIYVLTTKKRIDDEIENYCRKKDVLVKRGNSKFVLNRLYNCLKKINFDALVYWGADAPLMDYDIVNEALESFFKNNYDYLNNYNPPTFPEGYDINILSKSCLIGCYENALTPSQRINPFMHAFINRDIWKVGNFVYKINLSNQHWSLDYPDDYKFIKHVAYELKRKRTKFSIDNILKLINSNTKVSDLNHKLIRPIQINGFLNSPNIINEIKEDIFFLKSLISNKKNINRIKYLNEINKLSKVIQNE